MFTINRREAGYYGHGISFLATDQSGDIIGSAFAALEDDVLRLDSIQANPPKPEDVARFYAKRGISVTPDGNLEGKL